MNFRTLIAAAIALALAAPAAAAGMKTVYVGERAPIEKTKFPPMSFGGAIVSHRDANDLLRKGITIRICRLKKPSDCRYVVPAEWMPKTHTLYAYAFYQGNQAGWNMIFGEMPNEWLRDYRMRYRVCLMTPVKSPDMKPACQILEP